MEILDSQIKEIKKGVFLVIRSKLESEAVNEHNNNLMHKNHSINTKMKL